VNMSAVAGSPRDKSVRLADVLATPKLGEGRVACEVQLIAAPNAFGAASTGNGARKK